MKNLYEYKRVNFLNAFREMGFEFEEDNPSLLVEKILSIDKDSIGHANYEVYGGFNDSDKYIQSKSTNVPCLEGEWVVVCYSNINNKNLYKGKYYLCQIDFSEKYFFKIVKSFEHIYDAFKYLADNSLVSIEQIDNRNEKQISVQLADIVLTVLSDFEDEEQKFTYFELFQFFVKHSEKSKEINDYLKPKQDFTDEFKSRKLRRFLPYSPFDFIRKNSEIEFVEGYEIKLTIKEYLELVRDFRYNYIWNI